ncbi:hypothetical protein ANCCEY_02379 [Ancylostoma ceylanicum]|uniref:Uncharacterized protein n=1 Tax=Ancylostoma ceylanicum TaxID=53326 RepID=A0A0D6M4X3_9BILA|nr:hypothetical protein ANCCEY_02379 [Ancylostoma ceylanicum]
MGLEKIPAQIEFPWSDAMSFDFDLTAPFLPEFSTKDQSEHRHKIRPVQNFQSFAFFAPDSSEDLLKNLKASRTFWGKLPLF